MDERRYGEAEVREIFGRAAGAGIPEPRAPSAASGLTLPEMQSIGVEVGLDRDAVARAAASLDSRPARPRRSLGMPIEVARLVPLPRAPTDHEWEQLVGELRTTFGARGRITGQGNLREWSNGNLHACIEPAGEGYRLRLGTVKGNAIQMNVLGGVAAATGAITVGAVALSTGIGHGLFPPMMMAAGGVGLLLGNMLRLPGWARRRAAQMERIAKWFREIVAGGGEEGVRGGDQAPPT